MNEIYLKLEALEKDINSQLGKSRSSMLITTIFYAILVIFVAIYTTYIMNSLKIVATPSVVAEFLAEKVQAQIPLINEDINNNSAKYADILAEKTVESVINTIPALKFLVMDQLDLATNMINSELNTNYFPVIDEYFKLHKQQITEAFNTMTDEQAAVIIIDDLINELDSNIDLLNAPMFESIANLKSAINKLATTPNDKLTRQELAEKKVIAYWIFLLEHEPVAHSVID